VPAAIRILIVDEDALTRAGLSLFLGADEGIDVVGEAATGGDGVRMAAELAPDVVVVDAGLSDLRGVEVARRIVDQAEHPPPRVLLLTAGDDDEYAFRSMQTHISGYLPKNFLAPVELIRVVKAVASADGPLLAATAPQPGRLGPRQLRASLSKREVEVLRLMGRGLSNREIADELYVSVETVRTHVKHVYGKCGARNRTEAVLAAYTAGLVGWPRGRGRRGEGP
jgi:DNA-binding NarL/FixJ family response regulator